MNDFRKKKKFFKSFHFFQDRPPPLKMASRVKIARLKIGHIWKLVEKWWINLSKRNLVWWHMDTLLSWFCFFLSIFFLSSKKQLSISANTLRVNLKHVIFGKFDSRFLKSAVILNVNFYLVQFPYPSWLYTSKEKIGLFNSDFDRIHQNHLPSANLRYLQLGCEFMSLVHYH